MPVPSRDRFLLVFGIHAARAWRMCQRTSGFNIFPAYGTDGLCSPQGSENTSLDNMYLR